MQYVLRLLHGVLILTVIVARRRVQSMASRVPQEEGEGAQVPGQAAERVVRTNLEPSMLMDITLI